MNMLTKPFTLITFAVGLVTGACIGFSLKSSFVKDTPQNSNTLSQNHGSKSTPFTETSNEITNAASKTQASSHATSLGSPIDIEKKLASIINTPNAEQVSQDILNLITQAPVSELASLADSILKIKPTSLSDTSLFALMNRWAIVDPQTASTFCTKLPSGSTKANVCFNLAQAWGSSDSQAALKWAQSLPKGEARDQTMLKLCESIANKDPRAAINLLDKETPSDQQALSKLQVLQTWAYKDFAEAQKWIDQINDPEKKQEYTDNIIIGLSKKSPIEAATLVANMSASEEQTNLAISVAKVWAGRDPELAADWALQFPPGAARDEALKSVSSVYTETDPAKAQTWLKNLPEGGDRDNATEHAITTIIGRDYQAAWEMISLISNPELNETMRQHVQEEWQRMDPEAAKNALDTP